MIGKIIDMNFTDAFVNFEDSTTMYIGISHLPIGSKVGDTVNINPKLSTIKNDTFSDNLLSKI